MKTYEGDPRTLEVIVRDDSDGSVRPLVHYPQHSPDGFAWGYGGSGPAELARCILIDHFGLAPGEDIPASYQDFKFAVIATVPRESRLVVTTEDITDWLSIQRMATS